MRLEVRQEMRYLSIVDGKKGRDGLCGLTWHA